MNNIQEIFKKRRRNQIIASIIFAIVMVGFIFASDYMDAIPQLLQLLSQLLWGL